MSNPMPKGSFVRWQAVTIGQLTFAVNLILGFAVATLGFQVTLLMNDKFIPEAWQKCVFSASLLLLSFSVLLGIAVVVNRLRDFRQTMEVARLRESDSTESEIVTFRMRSCKLGAATWTIFWWQLGTFGMGITLTMLAVLAAVGKKLI